jgi:pyruvate/2-oxoglutarate/acetoin dehydrogenase E1 component/TPP-dependent pyruvate/acetoin dehydrogenase alpha subunit
MATAPVAPAAPAAALPAELSPDRLRELYALLWRIRLFEQRVLDLYKRGDIRGTAHLYIGQEAVAAGVCAALGPDDYVTSTHRGHGHCLARGLDPGPMLAEILGRADGYCKGKGGSMHVACPELGLLGADAVVGANAPIASGAALAAGILSADRVAVCFFGDGAANQGVLLETLNLATVLELPVVFVCENNLWALNTPAARTHSVPDVATRAAGFGLPGVIVDGQDALAVYQATRVAADRARRGGGPTLIEAKTYRYFSHSAFAAREIRPPDEVAAWKGRDPIDLLGRRLEVAGILTDDRLQEIRSQEEARVREAEAFALASPRPRPEEAHTDVFAPVPPEVAAAVEPGMPAAGAGVRTLTMARAINEALSEELRRDPRTLLLGEDVAETGGLFRTTAGLLAAFGPRRVIDTPISEQAFTGIGVGAAVAGARPIVEIQVFDFLSLAMDQLANHAAKLRYMTGGQLSVPLVVRGAVATGIGLAAQHSQSLEAWVAHIPGLKVIMPSTPYDAKGLLKSAIRDGNPVVCFEKRLLYATTGPVPEGEYLVPLGKAAVRRPGSRVTIVGSGLAARYAVEAAETLAEEGIDAEVIDLRTLVPLDVETIAASARKTHRVVVANDGHRTCGFAAELVATLTEHAFDYLDAPIARVTCDDVPIPCAENLEAEVLVSAQKIAAAVREVLG